MHAGYRAANVGARASSDCSVYDGFVDYDAIGERLAAKLPALASPVASASSVAIAGEATSNLGAEVNDIAVSPAVPDDTAALDTIGGHRRLLQELEVATADADATIDNSDVEQLIALTAEAESSLTPEERQAVVSVHHDTAKTLETVRAGSLIGPIADDVASAAVSTPAQGYNAVACQALLERFNAPMKELGDGFCNQGPWNTRVCAYDRGDCCMSTCKQAKVSLITLVNDDMIDMIVSRQSPVFITCTSNY